MGSNFTIPVVENKSIIRTGPVSSKKEISTENVEWVYSIYHKNDKTCNISLNGARFLGKGGYGETYLTENKIVIKLLHFTGESEHLDWRKEHFKNKGSYLSKKTKKYLSLEKVERDNKKKDEYDNNDNESDAFIADVALEVFYQEDANLLIKAIDGSPITPAVICSGVYIRIEKDAPKGQFRQENMVGVVVMEYVAGIPYSLVNLNEKPLQYLRSLRDQLITFSKNMKIQLKSIHGDTASDNIIIQEDKQGNPIVKIIDWGQADRVELEKYYYNKKIWKEWDDPSYYDKVTRREVNIINEKIKEKIKGGL
jgi:serine/threonine protein kinase